MKTAAVASTSKMTLRVQSGSRRAFIGIIPSSSPSLAYLKSLFWTQNFFKSSKMLLRCNKASTQVQSKRMKIIRQIRPSSTTIWMSLLHVQPLLRNWKCWWNSGWKILLKASLFKQMTWSLTSTDGWPTQQAVNSTTLFSTDWSTRWWKNTFKV